MLTQGSFSCPFVLHVWNRSFASAGKIKSLKCVQKRAAPLQYSRTASTVAGCVSLQHRLEGKPTFKISATLPWQHFDSNVYEIISLQILTTNGRAKVDKMLIGCSLLLGGTGACRPCSCPAFKPLQVTAGEGGLLTYLEGARTLAAFIGKKPKTFLKESQDFPARRHHREHQMQPLDSMDEGGSRHL